LIFEQKTKTRSTGFWGGHTQETTPDKDPGPGFLCLLLMCQVSYQFDVKLLYVPVTHTVHVPPFGPLKPALHVHAVIAVLVLGEFELVGQCKHAALPVAFLYFLDTHTVDVVPSGPLKPVLHLQSVSADFAIYEFEFTGQFKQVIALEYVAPVQSTHAALPVLPLYLPVSHNAQEPPFRPV
jgi:hypothetical protein